MRCSCRSSTASRPPARRSPPPTARPSSARARRLIDQVEERDGSRDYFAAQVVPAEEAATKAGDALTAEVNRQVAKSGAEADAAAASGKRTIVIAAVIAALAAVALAFLIVRSVVAPLRVVVVRLGMLGTTASRG